MPYVKIGGTWLETDTPSVKIGGTWIGMDAGYCKVGGAWHEWDTGGYDPVFANNDWSTIIEACQNNEVPDTWVVGDQKTMTINGVDYPIDIIGINHDTYSDNSGTAPLTFQMHDCYGALYAVNSIKTSVGGWRDCDMRNIHLPAIFSTLPTEVQNAIRTVNKLTATGYDDSTIITTTDKLFLLSNIEVRGETPYYIAEGEGTQYKYFVTVTNRVKTYESANSRWWSRSPVYYGYSDGSWGNFYAYENGVEGCGAYSTTAESGVSFAFCF